MSQQPPWNSYDSNERDPRRDQDQQAFAGPQSQWPTQASTWPQGQNQGVPAGQSQAPSPNQPPALGQSPNQGQLPAQGPGQGQQPAWPSQPSPWPAASNFPNQNQPPSWPGQTPSWPPAGQQPGSGQQPGPGQQPPYPGQQPYQDQPPYQNQAPYGGQQPYPGQQPWPGQQPFQGQQPSQGQQPYQGQPYQGQPYQGQPYQGQPYQGQPYQGQQPLQGQMPFQGQQPSWPQGGAGQPPFSGIGGYNYHNAGPLRYQGSDRARPRFRARRVRGAIFGIIAVILVGSGLKAVFSNDSSSSDASSGSAAVTPTSTQAASAPGAAGTYLKVQDATGDSYEVALVKVIDPAHGIDQFTTPDSGKRFVGLEFTIKGVSGTLQDEDANNDAVAIGSGGQHYPADFDQLAGYTNFDMGEIHVSKGQTATGTVTFQIPDNVKLAKVQWTSASGFGSTAQWNLKG